MLVARLSGLSALRYINGTVHVWDTFIVDLQGLENLAVVGGGFCFVMNNRMESFEGAGALKEVGGNFEVIAQLEQGTFAEVRRGTGHARSWQRLLATAPASAGLG